jgi:hypothetical protein
VSNENTGQLDYGNPNLSDAGQLTDSPPIQPSDGAMVDATNPVLSGELGSVFNQSWSIFITCSSADNDTLPRDVNNCSSMGFSDEFHRLVQNASQGMLSLWNLEL